MRDDAGHDGSLLLIGVNSFVPKDHGGEIATGIELIRSTEEEKGQQIANVQAFQKARNALVPAGETDLTHVAEDEAAVAVKHDGHGWGIFRTQRGSARMCSTR